MNLPIIFRRIAQAEFDDAADWFEARTPGTGWTFTSVVRGVLADIANQPQKWPEVYNDVREAPVAGYRFAIYYRIESRSLLCSTHHAIPAYGSRVPSFSQPPSRIASPRGAR